MFIRRIKNFCGRLLVTIRKMKRTPIEMYFQSNVLRRWRSWMYDESEFPVCEDRGVDWLSEETYNLMKEKYNNMPKKKKKAKTKKKKAKSKKKKKR
jgi:hypothetical protein